MDTFVSQKDFETSTKSPSPVPSGMMMNSRAENIDQVMYAGFLKTVWIVLMSDPNFSGSQKCSYHT